MPELRWLRVGDKSILQIKNENGEWVTVPTVIEGSLDVNTNDSSSN